MAQPFSPEDDEQQTLSRTALSTILVPVQVATSRSAVKAYLNTIFLLTASIVLLAVSTTAYVLFYYNYVPQLGLERVVYLQYGNSPHPHGITSLDGSTLSSRQPYDISVELRLPRTPKNVAVGNFMLDLSLLAESRMAMDSSGVSAKLPNTTTVIAESRRPASLPYQSPLLAFTSTVMALPWHILGFRDLNIELVTVPMFEHISFARGWGNTPAAIELEIQSIETLQVYSAKVVFKARFEGLRYVLYNHRVVSFLTFTSCFYGVSLASTSIAWLVISWILASHKDGRAKQEIEFDEGEKVKKELETGEEVKPSNGIIKKEAASDHSSDGESGLSLSNLSDRSATFPTLGRQMPLRFPVPRPVDSSSKASSKVIKQEPDDGEERRIEITAIEPLAPAATTEGAADDEDDTGEDARGRDRDSGIGTSMESEGALSGIQRRRSRRTGGSGSGRITPKREY